MAPKPSRPSGGPRTGGATSRPPLNGKSWSAIRADLGSSSSYVWLVIATVFVAAVLFGILRALTSLESGVAAAIIAASATVLISVFSLIYSKRTEHAQAIQEAQREHKREVYEEFMRFWFRTLAADSLGEKQPDEAEIMRFMATFTQELLLWGSDELLSEYVVFRQAAPLADEGEGTTEMIFAFERLLYAIRRDLGHSNKGLAAGDLLRLFITDMDTVLAELGSTTLEAAAP